MKMAVSVAGSWIFLQSIVPTVEQEVSCMHLACKYTTNFVAVDYPYYEVLQHMALSTR